jgi:hypothetical protein
MKIGVCSLAVGDKFRNDVKYGIRTKVEYCKKHGYDFIEDDSKTDYTRHLAWSKIPVILEYLSKYDYLVWMDADTIITNDNLKLEDFITRLLHDKELMYVRSKGWVNTGVMFIKNTEFMHRFMKASWPFTDKICWEQGAIDHLYRINWEGCQSKIVLVPDQTEYNSAWEQWRPNQFLIHFPGCGEPNRPKDCLRRMMEMFCVLKMDEETDEQHRERLEWMSTAETTLPILYNLCQKSGRYVPLDL